MDASRRGIEEPPDTEYQRSQKALGRLQVKDKGQYHIEGYLKGYRISYGVVDQRRIFRGDGFKSQRRRRVSILNSTTVQGWQETILLPWISEKLSIQFVRLNHDRSGCQVLSASAKRLLPRDKGSRRELNSSDEASNYNFR